MNFQLPITIIRKPRFVNYFGLVFSLLWLGALCVMGVMAGAADPFIYVVFGVMASIGLGILYFTARQIATVNIFVDGIRVKYSRKGLIGNAEWEMPVAKYRGVLQHTVRRSSGNDGHSSTWHCLSLRHDERPKDVLLYESLSDHGLRRRQEELARLLGLPALEEAEDGELVERSWEDLDRTVGDLLREGKMRRTGLSDGPYPGERAGYRDIEDGFFVESAVKSSAWKWLGVALLLGAIALFIFGPGEVIIPGIIMTAMGCLIFIGNFARTFLLVHKLRARSEIRLFGKRIYFTEVSLDGLEEIRTQAAKEGKGGGMTLIADTGEVSFDPSATPAEEAWLYDRLLRHIEQHVPPVKESSPGVV